MNRSFYAKLLGFVAALATAAVSVINGDVVTGLGLVAAALSSATVLTVPSKGP